MREIKFRAWDEKEKRMITWKDSESHTATYRFEISLRVADFDVTQYKYWKEADENRWGHRDSDDFILMQYVGLRDKNGKEIYEDDLLGWNNYTYRVYYNQYIAAYGLIAIGHEAACDYPEFNKAEVVGNAHENPELLEEK